LKYVKKNNPETVCFITFEKITPAHVKHVSEPSINIAFVRSVARRVSRY
jgi:hypothetical protein